MITGGIVLAVTDVDTVGAIFALGTLLVTVLPHPPHAAPTLPSDSVTHRVVLTRTLHQAVHPKVTLRAGWKKPQKLKKHKKMSTQLCCFYS